MPDENRHYAMVADEISTGRIDRALWAKALAHSNGEDTAAKGAYIRYRVEQLEKEEAIFLAKQKEQQRKEQMEKAARAAEQRITVSMDCPKCGHSTAKKEPRGDLGIGILLCFLMIVPGLIYALLCSGFRYTCTNCGQVIRIER
jgi:predicted RNA-binding Zn-ribbon protein involved in translation (DUF1610 family)